MSDQVRGVLTALAGQMPPARVPDDLWLRGRRRHRRRLSAAGGAVMIVLLLVAMAAMPWAGRGGPHLPSAGDPGIVPGRLELPWLWQASVQQSPSGPAAAVFFTDETRYLENTGVVVGRDGQYRLIYLEIGEALGVLSPDGRFYVQRGNQLLDLTTGKVRRLGAPYSFVTLSWSPDGKSLIATRDNNDPTITYDAQGKQLNEPAKTDDLLLVDAVSGETQKIESGRFDSYSHAAYAPDGTKVAVTSTADLTYANRLALLDASTGAEQWHLDLGARRMLAGSGAWSPDGERIALIAFDGCVVCNSEQLAERDWRIEFVNARTGQQLPSSLPVNGEPVQALGWTDDAHLVLSVIDEGAQVVSYGLDGERRALVDAPGLLLVPADLVAAGSFDGPSHKPSVFAAAPWFYPLAGIPTLLVLLLLAFRWWRRRRTAWTNRYQ